MNVEDIQLLVSALLDAEADVDKANIALSAAKERARRLSEETIPSAMQELGISDLKLTDGTSVKISDDVYVSIPKDNQEAAFDWLNSKGHGGLIKVDVITHYTKGNANEAAKLALTLEKKGLSVAIQQSVHSQTMKAFLREQLRNGAQIPLDLFGARPVNLTKVTQPKRK